MALAAEPVVRKRLTQAELDVICAKHDRLFQARPGGARAVFAWMDLSGLSLKGRNLADADFAAACLEGCDLTGAKLDNANFFGADMQDAILAEASLRRSDLRGACLRGRTCRGPICSRRTCARAPSRPPTPDWASRSSNHATATRPRPAGPAWPAPIFNAPRWPASSP